MCQMAVARRQTTTVTEDDLPTITILPSNDNHLASCTANHWRAPRRCNVLARMKRVARSTERVPATAKTAFERSLYGPKRWRVAAFAQHRFVAAHVILEPAHLRDYGCESHLIERQCR